MYSQITRRSDGLTDLDSPRLLHACADPAGYRSLTLGCFKPDALALFEERGSGLLLADAPAATNRPILKEAVLSWWLRVPSLAWESR